MLLWAADAGNNYLIIFVCFSPSLAIGDIVTLSRPTMIFLLFLSVSYKLSCVFCIFSYLCLLFNKIALKHY